MGVTTVKTKAIDSMTIDLFAPGMTALHRVGLAGLAMTLDALKADNEAVELGSLGSWEISDRSITLRWGTTEFFAVLIRQSFRIADGMFWFPALGLPSAHPEQAAVLQSALLGTFLQHPRTRKTLPLQTRVFEVDDQTLPVTLAPVVGYAHQTVKFSPLASFPVAGWLYPGGAVRHVQAGNATSLHEPPERLLALLYGPVGAVYFQIHRRSVGLRPRYAVVLPDVADILAYGEARRLFLRQGIARLQVAGTAEAAVRALSELEAHNLLTGLTPEGCEVIAFGTVAWSQQQKTRVERFKVATVLRPRLRPYKVVTALMEPRLRTTEADPKTGERRSWWDVPQTPDLVAENVIADRPWWHGFAEMWQRTRDATSASARPWALWNEQEGLQHMINHPETMPDGPEATLVRACHEAWRRRMGGLGERARKDHIAFGDLASREYERMRIGFARCKSAAMFRQTLTDFWGRAGGPLPDLQDAWPTILPFLDARWQEGRDLALLSLASYKPSERVNTGDTRAEPQAPEEGVS